MKKIIFSTLLVLFSGYLFSQDDENKVAKVQDLAVPNSPAFILMDISPSLIQTPSTPKTFILGIAQSFQQSSDGFPQNYSAEFAPYWWFNSSNRNIYTFLGLKTTTDANGNITPIGGENIFSGLKFTSVSIAFLNKDVIPDTFNSAQKVFSIGARSTLIKIHLKNYSKDMNDKIAQWHNLAQEELVFYTEQIGRATDPVKKRELMEKSLIQSQKISNKVKEITELMKQMPVFSWDIAAAYSTYGIGDSIWKTGRYGIWTSLSSYLPLDFGGKKPNKNYFNINVILRYLVDNYSEVNNEITTTKNLDIGAKLALIFDQLSIGVESEYRYLNFTPDYQNRTVGIINYKITDNLYINGAFGKNFNVPNKLIALFGINWGFGSEKINLPD